VIMTPGLRKFALTAHVISSVGFPGAVGCFLSLAVVGLASRDAQIVRAAYVAMASITWFVILPLSFIAPLTGIVSSLGTSWGLFRHYWVVVKLLMTVPSTVILMVHMQPISRMAEAAAKTTVSAADFGAQIQLTVASGAAVLVLIVATALSVYKPRGVTPYGWRKQQEQRTLVVP
jgi:hypothetical protein